MEKAAHPQAQPHQTRDRPERGSQGKPKPEGFGQACSYKLFSHRSYMVVPKSSSRDDRDRLTALAQIFGIGLVLYDSANLEQPAFDIQVRALRHEPDYFYVNKNLRSLEAELFG